MQTISLISKSPLSAIASKNMAKLEKKKKTEHESTAQCKKLV